MTATDFDLIIIGAGIHGAGVALAASGKGHRILVIEKGQVAGGTSSRSSKLIHGGLRYLESGQFGLVRECLQQRNWLLQNKPDLVKAVPFHIPVYRDTRRRPWQIRIGLGLYSLLSGRHPLSRHRSIPTAQWPGLDGLRLKNLQRVYQYWDAQTDDAALTRAILDEALAAGVRLAIPETVQKITLHPDHCQVCTGNNNYSAAMLVNAAGPWVNEIMDLCEPNPSRIEVDLVQGTHIVIPGQLSQGIYYLESPRDQRAIFAMPWKDNILIGTTEHHHPGAADEVRPLPEETAYLLECFAHYFPDHPDLRIIESFAGLRVLPGGRGSAFHRPRETIVHRDPNWPLVTIYGGKLTAFRDTAARVMDALSVRS